MVNDRTDLFAAFLAGLRDEPVNLVLTVGRDQDPAQFGPLPPHVHVERYIPQSLLFPHCDVVLTHGGSGTVMAALAHGLPLVVVPISADQPQNAARCAALGVGRVVEARDATPEAVRDAVRAVLTYPIYRRSAELLRDEIEALPGPEHAVALLEQLVAERRPLQSAA
jgi:MGT family glycosyltransferase